MLRVRFRPIRAGKEPRLREWLSELNARAGEVRATFRHESVHAEQAFVVDGASGPLLVYAVAAQDLAQAGRAFEASTHRIDAEHRAVLRECLEAPLEITASCSLSLDEAALEGASLLRVSFLPILEGRESRLRAWLAELEARADEVRATFRDESVRAEQAFVVACACGPVLVGVEEAADFERAASASRTSPHRIDAEHRAVLRECVGRRLDWPPAYDVSLGGGE
jgi:hypothetical protein